MFFIILLREMERPLFLSWTNYPCPSGRCNCIQYRVCVCVCVYTVCVCVSVSVCFGGGRGWMQGFPVEIIISHDMRPELAINAQTLWLNVASYEHPGNFNTMQVTLKPWPRSVRHTNPSVWRETTAVTIQDPLSVCEPAQPSPLLHLQTPHLPCDLFSQLPTPSLCTSLPHGPSADVRISEKLPPTAALACIFRHPYYRAQRGRLTAPL